MKIAGIQLDIAWEQPEANFERASIWIEAAAAAGARLVVLPEVFSYGFSMNTAAIAETPVGPSTQFLQTRAQQHGVWVCGSIPIRDGADKPANTLVIAGPQGQLHRYRKLYPFTFAGEHERYISGTERVTLDIEGLRCTVFICYDLRFADEFWAAAEDTDCYLVVANWPAARRSHWTALLKARAIENLAYVVGVNRVGRGGTLEYTGDSRILSPWGEALATAAETETMVLAEVDPGVVEKARATFPVLADRKRR